MYILFVKEFDHDGNACRRVLPERDRVLVSSAFRNSNTVADLNEACHIHQIPAHVPAIQRFAKLADEQVDDRGGDFGGKSRIIDGKKE